jgi:hypothetical protein
MKRITIERILIDADCVSLGEAESFRVRLQDELSMLLASDGLPESILSNTRVDGGELPASSGSVSPRIVAERVFRSLGGKV